MQAPQTPQPTRRDRWGRYLVVPPTGGKATGYTRATTIAKTLDDGGGLINWRSRMVALGLAGRPDLVALAATTDANDKRTLDDICERAAEAGGATARRDLGTALHGMLERSWVDAGYQAPDPYAADVAAVHDALERAGLTVVAKMHERIVVLDEHSVAGTFDLILTDGTENYVGDLKTGASLIGSLAFSIQLAIYANADALYTQGAADDGSEDQREPMPVLNRERGVIVHVQPGSGRCDLHFIDLAFGRKALDIAMIVRDMRKAKLLAPVPELPVEARTKALVEKHFPGAVDLTLVDDDWRAWMRGRIAVILQNGNELRMVGAWPTGVPTLASGEPITLNQAAELEAAVSFVEADMGLPFPDMKPGTEPVLPAPTPIVRRATPDEGAEVSQEQVDHANLVARTLDESARAWLGATLAAATKAKRNVRLSGAGGKATERRIAIAEALVALAPHADDELARALIALAIGEELQPATTLGNAVGSLSIAEAKRLAQLAHALDALTITATWSADGVSIVGDIQSALAA